MKLKELERITIFLDTLYIFILETNNLSHLKIELLSGLQLPDLT